MTLRQLFLMNDGRLEQTWDYVSSILSLLANLHRDSKKPAYQPDDFHPMVTSKPDKEQSVVITGDNIDLLKKEFVRGFTPGQ